MLIKTNFYDLLCEIQKDNRKIIKNNDLKASACIIYDSENFKLEDILEDTVILGSTPENVITALKNEKTWQNIDTLNINELNYNEILIDNKTTSESIKTWLAKKFINPFYSYVCGTIYIRNPMAQVLVMNTRDAKNVDELLFDVYWNINSSRKDMKNVKVDDLCNELGLISKNSEIEYEIEKDYDLKERD